MSSRLEQVLREHAEAARPGAVDVEEVRRRAGARQLRRRSVTVCAGALVLVLGIVTASQLVGRESGVAPQPAAPTTSAGPAPTALVMPAPADLRRGSAPTVGYSLSRDQLVLPGGRAVRVPQGRAVSAWTPYGDGVLVADTAGGDLRRYDSSGRLLARLGPGTSFAVSTDRHQVAWVPDEGGVAVMSDGGKVTRLRVPGAKDVVAFLVAGELAVDVSGRPTKLCPCGTSSRVPGVRSLLSGSDRLGYVAGLTARDDSAVVDPDSGRTLWRSSLLPVRFSLDGHYVLAQPTPTSTTRLAVLDPETGRTVRSLEAPAGYRIRATAWEGDDSLLMVVENGTDQALVRLGEDGSLERASAVTSASAATYVFAQQP